MSDIQQTVKASRPFFVLPQHPLFWSVALGHMTNDLFMNMGPVLLVYLSSTIMPISAAQIGLAVSAREIVSSLSQPFFGWLTDRIGGKWLGSVGVAWVAGLLMVSMALAVTGQFWLMLIPFSLSALGSGAFHPVGVSTAVKVDQKQEATNTGYFFLFGQTGLALGPALAGILLESAPTLFPALSQAANPITPIFWLFPLAIPGVVWMALSLPAQPDQDPVQVEEQSAQPARSKPTRIVVIPLIMIAVLVILRSIANFSTVNFIPVLFESKGWSPAQYGLITSSFWIASAVSGVIFGQLADRFDRRHVIAATLVLAAPVLFLLPLFDGPMAYPFALASGGLLGGSFSIVVVLAQRIIPAGKGFASGAILGFSFISGAIGNLFIGVLADGSLSLSAADPASVSGGVGLETMFQIVAGLALVAAVLALMLPKWVSSPALSEDQQQGTNTT
jgi:FSR family fosmidomycin resistance protein-like MFS transporter